MNEILEKLNEVIKEVEAIETSNLDFDSAVEHYGILQELLAVKIRLTTLEKMLEK